MEQKKFYLGRDINVFQTAVYKGHDVWKKELENLYTYKNNNRYSKKDLILQKATQAVENKLPTVVYALWETYNKLDNSVVINKNLATINNIFSLPNVKLVLKELFESHNEPKFNQLCEEVYYHRITDNDNIDIVIDKIKSKLAVDLDPKFSDYLGVNLLLTNKTLNNLEIASVVDDFTNHFVTANLGTYSRLMNEGLVEYDRDEVIEKFKFFEEGYKKWAFIDKDCKRLMKDGKESILMRTYFRRIMCNSYNIPAEELLSKKTDDELKKDISNLYLHMSDIVSLGTTGLFYKFEFA